MSDIQTYLEQIRNALFGEEVRSAIVNAINQCYQDAAEGVRPEFEFSEIQNGTRVTISVGDAVESFNVLNGAKTQLTTTTSTTASITCPANGNNQQPLLLPVTFPEGDDWECVACINLWSNNDVVNVYTGTSNIPRGGSLQLWWNNPASYARTVTFSAVCLFMKHVEEEIDTSTIVNTVYPVGSVYISTSSANPSASLGGTWTGSGTAVTGILPGESVYVWKRTE